MTIPSQDEQDKANMLRLRDGDDGGLNALMERYRQPLFHYLIRSLGEEAEAEDLAQETFVRIYQHRTGYDPRWKFTTWMFSIATNLVRDRRRWQSRHPEDLVESLTGPEVMEGYHAVPFTLPGGELEGTERAATVRRAVEALPEDLRTPLLLAEYQDQTHTEIAQILKCSTKAVESRLAKARQLLRKALKGILSVVVAI